MSLQHFNFIRLDQLNAASVQDVIKYYSYALPRNSLFSFFPPQSLIWCLVASISDHRSDFERYSTQTRSPHIVYAFSYQHHNCWVPVWVFITVIHTYLLTPLHEGKGDSYLYIVIAGKKKSYSEVVVSMTRGPKNDFRLSLCYIRLVNQWDYFAGH